MRFRDRADAGRALGAHLRHLQGTRPVVLGLPRGGVPVAYEVARLLDAPLDIVLVRKLGVPYQPELGMGAVGEGGVRVINDEIVRTARVDPEQLAEVERRQRAVVEQRARHFRSLRPRVPLAGRTAVVVDDGIATGSTARAACQCVRAQGAHRIVLATPVASRQAIDALRRDADEIVCLEVPAMLTAIGQAYDDFSQVSDETVAELLERAGDPVGETGLPGSDADVRVDAGGRTLPGHLSVPDGADQLVLFAHGSGSGRLSPRNRYVAEVLQSAGMATLLFDLLTEDEADERSNVFDIPLLAERLGGATAWAREQPGLRALHVAYFGASTGAAAALWAAAEPGADITAVVSRGGRPDLAAARLAAVRAPTLLIVGGADPLVLDLNRRARHQLRCPSRIAVVPGATHLFEQPGALRSAAELARDWLLDHPAPVGALPPRPGPGDP